MLDALLVLHGGLASAQAVTFESRALQQKYAVLTMGGGEEWVLAFPWAVVNVLSPLDSGLSARINGPLVSFTPTRASGPVQVTVVLPRDVRPFLLVTFVPGRGLTPQLGRVTAPEAAGSAPVSVPSVSEPARAVVAPVNPASSQAVPPVPPVGGSPGSPGAAGSGTVTLVPLPGVAVAGPVGAVAGSAAVPVGLGAQLPAAQVNAPGPGRGAGTNKNSPSLRRTVGDSLLRVVSPALALPEPVLRLPLCGW